MWKKAYMPCTKEEDEILETKYREEKDIEQLAVDFQRKPGAIKSRFVKLGLMKPGKES